MSSYTLLKDEQSRTATADGHHLSKSVCELVLLRSGSNGPPLFLLPGGGGGKPTDFSIFAQHIRYDHAIYAIRLEDLERDIAAPQKRIEHLAQFCLKVIEERQPSGPYFFLGHSLGGLILMEAAHELSERREEIAMLGFLDSYPNPRHWPFRCWLEMLVRRCRHHARSLTKLPIREALVRAVRLGRGFMDHFRVRRGVRPHKWREPGVAHLAPIESPDEALGNWAHYRPRYYDNKIMFFKAEIPTDTPSDPLWVWRKFAKSIEILVVPGNHVDMLTTHARELADSISRCLDHARIAHMDRSSWAHRSSTQR